jgi:hypothetical protein
MLLLNIIYYMVATKSVKCKFYDTLKMVSESSDDSFSGIGLVLYETGSLSEAFYAPLRPSFSCPNDLVLADDKTVNLLLEISRRSSPLHDGFVFSNQAGIITHLAQYFSPSPKREIPVNECYGARYHTAHYGSLLEGVILTGIVNSDKMCHLFQNGRTIRLVSEIE